MRMGYVTPRMPISSISIPDEKHDTSDASMKVSGAISDATSEQTLSKGSGSSNDDDVCDVTTGLTLSIIS